MSVRRTQGALRWRIKDLIDFHINDAALDVFDLPRCRARRQGARNVRVAARTEAIQKRADLLTAPHRS